MDDIKRNEKDFNDLKQKSLISSLGTAYESFHSSLLKLPRNHYSASLLAPSTLKQKEYKTNGNFETHSTIGNSLLNVESLTTNVNLSKKYSHFASHHNEHLSSSHLSNIAVPHRVVDLGNTYEENSLYPNTTGEGAKESPFNTPMYFGTENSTVIATQIGATAHIPCTVHHIGDCMVSWIRKKDYHLLTVGLTTYSSDERFSATHLKHSEDWTLQIKFVQQRDAGIYECQVSTHPPTSIFLHLLVVEARAEISGPPIRYLTPGSTLRLQCLVVQNTENSEYIFWYHDNRMINYDVDRGINVSTEPDFQSSELTISRTRREHSGNYTCVASNTQPASVLVHIFKGDNPAAMYHGHVGSSTKSYQTHLIHTVLMIVAMTYRSYVKRKFFL